MTLLPPPALLATLLLFAPDAEAGAPARGFPFAEPVQPPRALQAVSHRGGPGSVPENSAAAINRAAADTVEWVEVDVRRTKDGHHVLIHDETLDRVTDGRGRVLDHTLEQLRALDPGAKFARRFAGERILTLPEALKAAQDRVNLYLDCKDVDPARLAREVLDAKAGRRVVVYGPPEVLRAVRAGAGEEVGLMAKWRPAFGLDPWVDQVRPHAVEVDAADVTADVCREFHRRGIKVEVKALGGDDRPEVWDRAAAAGADWVQTDRPEEVLARQSLKALGADRAVKVAHHRGASRYAPENTLPAYAKSFALGADLVEFDVRTTRDGAFVLLHDGSLDRTTTGRGQVRDRTAAEVAALDAGAWFGRPFVGTKPPTFDEFLDAAKGSNAELYVDAKEIAPEALVAALARHGLTGRAVVYQGPEYLEKLRAIAPDLRRMPPLRDPSEIDALVKRVKPYAFDTRWSILSKSLIDRCHAQGVKVFSDALGFAETVEQYQKAARDGIDVIQTDFPVRVLRALELLAATTRSAAAGPAGTTVLFDGKTLDGWKPAGFYREGEIKVEGGAIVLPAGRPMSGVTSTRRDLPTTNYELTYEAQRRSGRDFFAAATFPVGKSFLTFVNGGWGGSVTGLSSLNGADASENETGRYFKYENDTWYKFRVRVTDEVIRCWIGDKEVVALNYEGRQVGTRIETRSNQPLGFATWESTGAVRNVAVRPLSADEVAAHNKIDD